MKHLPFPAVASGHGTCLADLLAAKQKLLENEVKSNLPDGRWLVIVDFDNIAELRAEILSVTSPEQRVCPKFFVLVEGMEYLGCVEDMHIMTSEVEMVPVPMDPPN